jgi:hypothetical protein
VIVELDDFPDLGLIIKAPTGVRYSNQSGGFACEHPETEGFFVPLRTRAGRSELTTLAGVFRGAWNRLDDVQADAADGALRRHGITSIRVDRSMLSESREAWVHVIVLADDKDFVPLGCIRGGEGSAGLAQQRLGRRHPKVTVTSHARAPTLQQQSKSHHSCDPADIGVVHTLRL